MIKQQAQAFAAGYFKKAGIFVTEQEQERIEITDFGLGDFEKIGLAILTYVNTDRCCAKELVLLPNQICPEHRHPNVGDKIGKEETFRCRIGTVEVYVNQQETPIVLEHGGQLTIQPNTLHWFKAGSEGAIVSEFSTRSTDENDIFTEKRIVR